MLTLACLGVVYGDIGTSPLYAFRECFIGEYGIAASRANILGVLSLIVWSLVAVISIKYLVFIIRADNDGEGGILALTELVRRDIRPGLRNAVLVVGLFGAALLYGDGAITPAISVLSAIEGLNVATPVFEPYVVPLTIVVLVGLFSMQRLGTGGVGKLFGPLMLLWFGTLAVCGIGGVVREPSVFAAVNPLHGVAFFHEHGLAGLTILGIAFLVVTGGEALYADIGHFGTAPIRIGWFLVALPSLLLNYFGQGALLMAEGGKVSSPFYQLAPSWALYPLVGLSTIATVIASQAIISGMFSLTYQGVNLGYLPMVRIRHTSTKQRGQIYDPAVNWFMLAATIGLVLGFRHSGNLAAAYGVAIATTMVITTLLFSLAARKIFRWPTWIAVALTAAFLVVDLPYFVANIGKFADGGWFPLMIAALILAMMQIWRRGYASERRKSRNRVMPIRDFLREVGGGGTYRRVPGQAVYLAANARGTPLVLRHNLRLNRALHDTIVIYTAIFIKAPRADRESRLKVKELRHDIHRVIAYYGFMEEPDVRRDLEEADRSHDLGIDFERVSYFVGNRVPVTAEGRGLRPWQARLYALMARNEAGATRYFQLPAERVMEVGTQIEL